MRHKYNFHTLRHSFATYLRNKGMPLEDIKEIMGHARFDTTFVYAKLGIQQLHSSLHKAFDVQARHQIIPQEEVRRASVPQPGMSAIEHLRMKLVNEEITDEEFANKARMLQMTIVKQLE